MQVGIGEIAPLVTGAKSEGLLRGATGAAGEEHAEAARKFETLIATLLVKELRRGLPEGFFGAGPGADVYEGWLDEQLGENLASSWKLDLAGMVKTSLDSKQARLEGKAEPAKEGVE